MAAMIGRDAELAAVLRVLTKPEVTLTLVMGEAGIGKSRLVAEVVAATPERLTLAGGCLPISHALPLLPIVDALDTRDPAGRRALTRAARAVPRSLRPNLAGVMPRTLPEEIQRTGEVRRDLLFIAAEALLSRVAEECPVTLVVEDLQWADPDTLDLLTYLSGAGLSTGLSLLVTCRADETRMSESVAEWLDVHGRSSASHELRLGPLDADEVRRLVATLPHPQDLDIDLLAGQVFARGEGNPFFTEQLVASAGRGEMMPERLAKLLSARVHALSPSAREAITALAVLGRPVPVEAVRLVTLHSEETGLAAVRELESAFLVLRNSGGVRPRHALLVEALLAEQPGFPGAFHRRVAHALEALDDPSTSPEIADHLHEAGDEAAELRVAQRAARRSWELGAYAEAARWYQRVTDLHARHPEEPLALAEPEVVRRTVRALDLGGDLRSATALAERALSKFADWPHLSDRLSLLSCCVQLVSNEEPERGERLVADLLRQYETLPPHPDHAYLLSRIATRQMRHGDNRTALAFEERALAVARAADDLDQEAEILARTSTCYRFLGDREAADRNAIAAIQTAERSPDTATLLSALIHESDNRLKYAELDAAITVGERGIAVADQKGLRHSHHAHLLVNNTAEAYLALGRTDEVGRLVDGLTDHPLRRDDDVLHWLRAHADLRRGDLAGALTWLRNEGPGQPPDPDSIRDNGAALAYVLLWDRRPAEALEVVSNSMPSAAIGDYSQEVGLLLSLGARAAADLVEHDERSSTDAIARLEQFRDGMALDPFADRSTLPRATADRRQWQAELSRAGDRSDPDAWTDAASAWESLSMPHDAAYCWWRAAAALRSSNPHNSNVRDALQAAYRLSRGHLPLRHEIVKLAAAARIPILKASDVDDNPAQGRGLTAQETKVLRLLAGGFTNAEIGGALFISPKTASVHVSNLVRKLDLANRTEAAVWAVHHGLTADT